MGNITLTNGLFNNYTVKPTNISGYTSFRGVTDFSQIGKFNQYETGYQFLSVIKMPKFLTVLAEQNSDFGVAYAAFRDMLENEFRGLEGLPDIQADTYSITDGINEIRMINRVTEDTSATVSMQFFERQGSLIEKFSEYYLTGIKDLKTQAKTYHGLIRSGLLEPSLEHEVFTLLFYATDNTMTRLESATLLANAQLTKAERSMYNGSRSDINNHEVSVEFNCFPIHGEMVDKAAKTLLEDIVGVNYDPTNPNANAWTGNVGQGGQTSSGGTSIYLDSTSYNYGIMQPNNKSSIKQLTDAAAGTASLPSTDDVWIQTKG